MKASQPSDQAARDRFAHQWDQNLAIVANAGSGKTTAISRRLAAMAATEEGGRLLEHTAVVTFTKKAAAQIGRRARAVAVDQAGRGGTAAGPLLARLDRAFFGTIHSFCIRLARQHGSEVGIHLNPTVVEEDDTAYWEAFIESDPMEFSSLAPAQVEAFLRHAELKSIFELAQDVTVQQARRLAALEVAPQPPPLSQALLDAFCTATTSKGRQTEKLKANQEKAARWAQLYRDDTGPLPIPGPDGTAAAAVAFYREFFGPLRSWLACAGGVLAAELAQRYRDWRLDRGIQTYADQVDTALAVLGNPVMLDRIRGEGWRVILDEAQDTDESQFEVLVEITRPPGAARGDWPGSGQAPRPGHLCLVGDAQQGIYANRANVRNFQRHVEAVAGSAGGARLTLDVTFRAPRSVVDLLNGTLPQAFGGDHDYSYGLGEGGRGAFLQVPYERLVAGPSNAQGGAWVLPLAGYGTGSVGARFAAEARGLARHLAEHGPQGVGASSWGDICILAPRTKWLPIVRAEFEAAHLKTALQLRRNRSGDNPAYAWVCGLLAVVCDPTNTFEWAGVLREVFAVSDASIARALRAKAGFAWDEPDDHEARVAEAMRVVGRFISRVDDEGQGLWRFAEDLVRECGLGWKARAADPEGGVEEELARLLSMARELGAKGAGPRDWLDALLSGLERMRALGRPAADAINLVTCHSAKGLEWPVVIPVGMWRFIKYREGTGLRLVGEMGGEQRIVFSTQDMGDDTREARRREWQRESVRLLYVTLTRPQRALVVPWPEGATPEPNSLVAFWGIDPMTLPPVPASAPEPVPEPAADAAARAEGRPPTGAALPPLPDRVLPHLLAEAPDPVRGRRHEASSEDIGAAKEGIDPLDYGTWWHETVEGIPWADDPVAIGAYVQGCLRRAEDLGFGERGRQEWHRFTGSEAWARIREPRWTQLAEVGIFAPLGPGRWIDGVIDLVLHDPAGREAWIIDWKTNRRRAGEPDEAFLARLRDEYAPQLKAYGSSVGILFKDCAVRLWVYSTAAGAWTEVGPA
jgi:ATP-dependent helicase/nuclease subunit A